jgi:hypothetical protein
MARQTLTSGGCRTSLGHSPVPAKAGEWVVSPGDLMRTVDAARSKPQSQWSARARERTARMDGSTAPAAPVPFLLSLQRLCGNQVVTRLVQRCGPVPCSCSDDQRRRTEVDPLQSLRLQRFVETNFPGGGKVDDVRAGEHLVWPERETHDADAYEGDQSKRTTKRPSSARRPGTNRCSTSSSAMRPWRNRRQCRFHISRLRQGLVSRLGSWTDSIGAPPPHGARWVGRAEHGDVDVGGGERHGRG